MFNNKSVLSPFTFINLSSVIVRFDAINKKNTFYDLCMILKKASDPLESLRSSGSVFDMITVLMLLLCSFMR